MGGLLKVCVGGAAGDAAGCVGGTVGACAKGAWGAGCSVDTGTERAGV
jgi:hypothetical protein